LFLFSIKKRHPALFSRPLFNELLEARQAQGARYVLYSNEDKVLELETSESGILIGIDTPEDYKLHFGVNP